jgi:thymidylate synthase (FAD)
VKSTRYTLKELKEEESFKLRKEGMGRAANYVVFTGRPAVDFGILEALNNLRQLIASGIPNDLAKFALPDAYKTNLVWTINARSLQNFLYLRTAKSAMWEIRKLAYEVYRQLPEDHKYLFEDSIYSAAENLHE